MALWTGSDLRDWAPPVYIYCVLLQISFFLNLVSSSCSRKGNYPVVSPACADVCQGLGIEGGTFQALPTTAKSSSAPAAAAALGILQHMSLVSSGCSALLERDVNVCSGGCWMEKGVKMTGGFFQYFPVRPFVQRLILFIFKLFLLLQLKTIVKNQLILQQAYNSHVSCTRPGYPI